MADTFPPIGGLSEKHPRSTDDSKVWPPDFGGELEKGSPAQRLSHQKHKRDRVPLHFRIEAIPPTTPRKEKRKGQLFGTMRDTFYDAQAIIEETSNDEEMLSNAEAADTYLSLPKDHSLTPGSSPDKKSTQGSESCMSCTPERVGSTKTFPAKLVTEEVDLDVGEDAAPRVKWNHNLPGGTVCKSTPVAGQSIILSNANSSRARYTHRSKRR